MKTAIASEGKDMESQVSPAAGRAPYYLIFENGKLAETLKNPFSIGGGGAGWSVAKMLGDKRTDIVIAGSFGPNMTKALEERGVKHSEHRGSVKEALEDSS